MKRQGYLVTPPRSLSCLLLMATGMLGACASGSSIFGEPTSSYHREVKRETRSRSFFGLEKVRYQTAMTFRSRNLRKAYVEEFSEKYHLSPEEQAELLQKELAEAETYDVFFVSHFATDKDTARLTEKAKVWRLLLSTKAGGMNAVEPESIGTLSSGDPVVKYFYPHISPWSKNFLVKFPRENGGGYREVKMVGVIDQLSFVWEARP